MLKLLYNFRVFIISINMIKFNFIKQAKIIELLFY